MPIFTQKIHQSALAVFCSSVLLFTNTAHAEGSDYTSLNIDTNDCRQDLSESFYLANCPSKQGYKIEVTAGDNHTAIFVVYNEHKVNHTPSTPSDIGKLAEWRHREVDGVKHYYALIYRALSAKMDEDDSAFVPRNLKKQELVVIRLDKEKSCVISIVSKSKDMNERARQIADDTSSQCIN